MLKNYKNYKKIGRKYSATSYNLRKSSDIFIYFRKMIGNVKSRLMNFRQSSENERKSSGNCQNLFNIVVYIINRILHVPLVETNFIFSWSTRSLRSLGRYRVEHSQIKFISTRRHVISSTLYSFPRLILD